MPPPLAGAPTGAGASWVPGEGRRGGRRRSGVVAVEGVLLDVELGAVLVDGCLAGCSSEQQRREQRGGGDRGPARSTQGGSSREGRVRGASRGVGIVDRAPPARLRPKGRTRPSDGRTGLRGPFRVPGPGQVRFAQRRGVEQFGQLAGLITRRSQVQILPPLLDGSLGKPGDLVFSLPAGVARVQRPSGLRATASVPCSWLRGPCSVPDGLVRWTRRGRPAAGHGV
jgi:hypothetical protein